MKNQSYRYEMSDRLYTSTGIKTVRLNGGIRLLLVKMFIIISIMPSSGYIAAQPSLTNECVIVLHGLHRSKFSMHKIATTLSDEGYRVHNKTYPSTEAEVDVLAVDAIGTGLEFCRSHSPEKVHFVTHSLGGILVRSWFQENKLTNLGRIVMLSPPNKGSEVADTLRDMAFFKRILGPSGQQLGTDDQSVPNTQKPISGEIGIITGQSTSDPWFSPLIPGDDDGKVSIESAKLAEMKDFLVVNSGHTFIMRNDEVIEQVLYFLRHGQFRER